MFAGRSRGVGLAVGLVMVLVPLVHGGGPAAADQRSAAGANAETVSTSAQAQVPSARRVPTVTFTAGQKLGVRVQPAQVGPGAWKFTLEREEGTKWVSAGTFRTIGSLEEAELPVGEGTYRVVVPAQNGLQATVSVVQRYAPAPAIEVSGSSRLVTDVSPVSMRDGGWTVTLERKTAQGWSKVRTATTSGVRPVVSAVGSGTYRVRTDAQGRFPAFTSKPFAYRQQAPAGPVDYALIDEAFPSDSKTRSKQRAASSGCGSVKSSTAEGLSIATGFLSLVPVAGGALAAVTGGAAAIVGAEGANAGSACVQAEFDAINVQLAFQESQIESLQSQLQATTSAIIQGAYVLQSETTGAAAYDYNTATQSVQGSFNTFMLDGGFWLGPQSPNPYASVSSSASTPEDFYGLVSFADSQTTFVSNLNDASGSSLSCSGALVPPSNKDADPNCYLKVAMDSGSASVNLDRTMGSQLQSQILVNLNSGANIVPLFDQYNQGLAAFYQQSVSTLQQAFMMEYTINQMNYYNGAAYTNGQVTSAGEIASLGEVAGTYYSFPSLKESLGNTAPTAAQQAEYYNRAQKALSQVYAARVNQLYLNTIGFIVSDVPIAGSQSYPTDGSINGAINYAASVGRYVTTAAGVTASTPLGMLPKVATAGASWQSSAALYQYSGLRNVGVCSTSLKAYNAVNGASGVLTGPTGALNATTCPSILTAAGGAPVSSPQSAATGTSCVAFASQQNTAGDGSCYDGNSLVPFFGQAGSVTLGSAVINNLMLCDDSDPTLTWFQVGAANAGNLAGLTSGDSALTCANWGQTGSNNFPASTQPLFWSDEATVPAAPSWASPDQGLWPIVTSSYGGGSYVIDSGYYYPPLTTVPYQLLKPPLNIGGPNLQTAVNSGNDNYGANVSFPKSSTGACSVVWMGDSSVDNSLSGGNCNLYFMGVSLKCEQDGPASCLSYSTQYTSATIGVRLPNAATGSLDGGFVLPLTIGTFGGYPITLGGSPYCADNCTLLDMWVTGKTTIANQGFTTSCSTAVNPANGVVEPATNSYGLAAACSIVLPDGGMYEISVGRTNNGTGTFQVTPTTGLGTPW